MTFGNWDSTIHKNPEQVKRITSAQKISVSKITISPDTASAKISGSGETPYDVTLLICTCGDFISRRLPCKHIYRLAIELGEFSDLPVMNSETASAFDIEVEISRFYALYKSGVISGDKFSKIAEILQKPN